MTLNLEHLVKLPPHTGSPGRRFPAVVMVHGWQGNENGMSIFERTLPAGVAIVSPRALLDLGDNQFGWYLADDPDSFTLGLTAFSEFVRGLPREYPVEPEHVVLMGFSQGAALGLSLLLSEPRQVEAVAALAGFLPEPAPKWLQPGRLAGKSVFMAHGSRDATVPVELARATAEALRKYGAEVDFCEYDVAHRLNAAGIADLKGWLAGRAKGWATLETAR